VLGNVTRASYTPTALASAFDYTVWTALFVLACVCEVFVATWYVIERLRWRRPYYIRRTGLGLGLGVFWIVLIGLRRFAFHE
jgi:hypothetical protein